MQGSYLALSSLQRKAAPGSELKATSTPAFFFFVLILFLGFFVKVVSGGVVSGGPEVSTLKSQVATSAVARPVGRSDLEGIAAVGERRGRVGLAGAGAGPEVAAADPALNVVGL